MPTLKLKVCGMKSPDNVAQVASLRPDFMGFIFYPSSPRFVGELHPDTLNGIPQCVKRVGVFVDSTIAQLAVIVKKYALDAVQLHGHESPEMVREVKALGVEVIKAFGVLDRLPLGLEAYASSVDYFLFDRFSTKHGGSGLHFDWSLLASYPLGLGVPFLLSGGIDLQDVAVLIERVDHPSLAGIDINSQFELRPGYKDVKKIEALMRLL